MFAYLFEVLMNAPLYLSELARTFDQNWRNIPKTAETSRLASVSHDSWHVTKDHEADQTLCQSAYAWELNTY